MTKYTQEQQESYSLGHDMGYKAYMDRNYRNQNPFDSELNPDLFQGWDEGYSDAKENNQ